MKLLTFAVVLILPLAMVKQATAYEETSTEEKSFKMKPGGNITVIGDEGYIKVNSWDRDEVMMILKKRVWARSRREARELLKKIDIKIEHTANRLYVRQTKLYKQHNFSIWDIFDPDKWSGHSWSVVVDFELKVPRKSDLRLEADEGYVDVNDIWGDLDIEVDEGDVVLKDIESNRINVAIDEGDLDCYNITGDDGRVNLDTDEGSIRLEKGKIKKLRVDCDEGDIYLKNIDLHSCEIETDEGDIEAKISIHPRGKYRMYTDEGDVFVYLPRNVDLDVKLETEEGRIDTDFDLTITDLDDGERIQGTIGNGGARLEVYTDEGDISLEKL